MKTLACIALLMLPSLVSGQAAQLIPKPEVKVGESWTYRGVGMLGDRNTHDYVVSVTSTSQSAIQVIATRKQDGKEFDAVWTPEWNAVASYTRMLYKPSTGILRFPLAVGNRHATAWDGTSLVDVSIKTQTEKTVEVIGWEDIQVPAGTFRALRIATDGTVRRLGAERGARFESTFWYVPEVKRWVKLSYKFTPGNSGGEELLEYKLQ